MSRDKKLIILGLLFIIFASTFPFRTHTGGCLTLFELVKWELAISLDRLDVLITRIF